MAQDTTLHSLRQDVDRLRRDIEGKQRALVAYEEALSLLEAFSSGSGVIKQEAPKVLPEHPAVQQLQTFAERVKSVLHEYFATAQFFTVAEVEIAMADKGLGITGKAPRKKIAMALADLEKENIVKRTFRGGGNVPHHYKVVESVSV